MNLLSHDLNCERFTLQAYERLRVSGLAIAVMGLLLTAICSRYRTRLSHALNRRTLSEDFQQFIRLPSARLMPADLAILCVTIACGLAARLSYLNQPMRGDECITFLQYGVVSFLTCISDYGAPNNHLLNSALINLCVHIFPEQPWLIRLPSLIFGLAIIPATFLYARAFHNKACAPLAAALVAGSSYLVEYSVLARGYTMVAAATLLMAVMLRRLLMKPNTLYAGFLAVTIALGCYAIPTMVYSIGGAYIWMATTLTIEKCTIDRRAAFFALASITCGALLTVLLYLPVIIFSGPAKLFCNEYVEKRPFHYWIEHIPTSLLQTWDLFNRDVWPPISALLVVCFFLSAYVTFRRTTWQVPFVAMAILATIALLTVQQVLPYPRVWLFVLPLYLSAAAHGLSYSLNAVSNKRSTRKVLCGSVAVAIAVVSATAVIARRSIWLSDEGGYLPEANEIVEWLRANWRQGQGVFVVAPKDVLIAYYFRRHSLPEQSLHSEYVNPLAKSAVRFNRCVFVIPESCNPERSIEKFMDATGYSKPIEAARFAHALVYFVDGKNQRQ